MTLQEREEVIDALFDSCKEILDSKGRDYSGPDDSLSNFKRNADRLGMTKYQIWVIYFAKHVDSIINSIKTSPSYPQTESEPIEGRIQDAINYLAILHALIVEDHKLKF